MHPGEYYSIARTGYQLQLPLTARWTSLLVIARLQPWHPPQNRPRSPCTGRWGSSPPAAWPTSAALCHQSPPSAPAPAGIAGWRCVFAYAVPWPSAPASVFLSNIVFIHVGLHTLDHHQHPPCPFGPCVQKKTLPISSLLSLPLFLSAVCRPIFRSIFRKHQKYTRQRVCSQSAAVLADAPQDVPKMEGNRRGHLERGLWYKSCRISRFYNRRLLSSLLLQLSCLQLFIKCVVCLFIFPLLFYHYAVVHLLYLYLSSLPSFTHSTHLASTHSTTTTTTRPLREQQAGSCSIPVNYCSSYFYTLLLLSNLLAREPRSSVCLLVCFIHQNRTTGLVLSPLPNTVSYLLLFI